MRSPAAPIYARVCRCAAALRSSARARARWRIENLAGDDRRRPELDACAASCGLSKLGSRRHLMAGENERRPQLRRPGRIIATRRRMVLLFSRRGKLRGPQTVLAAIGACWASFPTGLSACPLKSICAGSKPYRPARRRR